MIYYSLKIHYLVATSDQLYWGNANLSKTHNTLTTNPTQNTTVTFGQTNKQVMGVFFVETFRISYPHLVE
jgi:hypothetical protein